MGIEILSVSMGFRDQIFRTEDDGIEGFAISILVLLSLVGFILVVALGSLIMFVRKK